MGTIFFTMGKGLTYDLVHRLMAFRKHTMLMVIYLQFEIDKGTVVSTASLKKILMRFGDVTAELSTVLLAGEKAVPENCQCKDLPASF